ncbi:MAG: hypothetical protein FJY76_02770 [Candidatus Aenigmarchaeota archaeon]|nr:hypothetical protein [Candidatus Aenigmarchaeota archaeon]
MSDKAFAGLAALFVLSVLSAPALALSTPSVTFIPDKVSTNAAFIMIADPHAAPGDSVIVTWGLNGPTTTETNRQGSFPRSGSRYVCYFSSTDNESTCGPAPFKTPSSVPPRSFSVTAINQLNTTGVFVANISVGDIQILPSAFTTNGVNITIFWSTYTVGTFRYAVYYASNFTSTGFSGIVPFDPLAKGYSFDVPTGPGEYLISLRIDEDATGKFGGTVVRYEIPESGIYAEGGPVKLVADPVSFEVLLNRGQNYQRTGFSITSIGSNPLGNLSVAVPSAYSPFLSVTLANTSIAPNGTIFYTVVIGGPQHTMEINTRVNVTSSNITIGYIPIKINVSIVNECEGVTPITCPAAGSGISVSPTVWTGSYLAGKPATLNFTVTNRGNTTLSNITHTSDLGSSLSVSLPGTILPSGYAQASATLTPSYGGLKSGTITITSPQGSASIAVLANFYEDASSSLSDLQLDYADFQSGLTAAQRGALSDAFISIDSDISSAQSAQDSGDYAGANDYYIKAAAKLGALKSAFAGPIEPTPEPVNIDFTTILIIVVVIAAAAGAFIFIRRRRQGGGEDLEEELGEEFGPLPGEEGQ